MVNKSKSVRKRRATFTTVSDVLASDDVNQILADVVSNKANIKDLIVISTDMETGKFTWQVTDETLISQIVWLLEKMKADIINENFEED